MKKEDKKENPYHNVPSTVLSYFAGLLDAEGHIGFCARGFPVVKVKMADKELLEEFAKVFNVTCREKSRYKSFLDHYRTQYEVELNCHRAKELCEALHPYFITKHDISLKIIEHYNTKCPSCGSFFIRKGSQKYCCFRCKELGRPKKKKP